MPELVPLDSLSPGSPSDPSAASWPTRTSEAYRAPLPGLATSLALRLPRVLDPGACERYAAQVLNARQDWTKNFAGVQFTLGRAWYTHLEEDREDEYFANAEASDATVRRATPGLQERMLAAVSAVLEAPVTQRPGWCGPGVHIFPARSVVARKGGEVHFDTEGLTEPQLARRAAALSFILMLQPPEVGGGLRVWDRLYDGEDFPDKPEPDVPVTQIAYEPGELVVIDSYRLHQILPFAGSRDRISATMHAALEGNDWEAWF
jgi:hypothetical protein